MFTPTSHKKNIILSFIITTTMLFAGLFTAPVASAQTNTPDSVNRFCVDVINGSGIRVPQCFPSLAACKANPATKVNVNICDEQALTPSQQAAIQAQIPIEKGGNWFTNLLSSGVDLIVGNLVEYLAQFIFWIAGVVLSISGNILDYSIEKSISSGLIRNLVVVDVGWRLVRDFCNMAFIFILLYVAIATVLDIGVNTKRTLANVVLAALLINFSLFFGKVIIDFGNVFAKQLWEQNKTQVGTLSVSSAALPFVEGGKLQSTLDPKSAQNKTRISNLNNFQRGFMYIMGALVLFIMSYCFMFGAFLMAYRLVSLIMLLVFSPFAFLGLALPKWSYFDKWLSEIFSQSIVAPVLLFMLYLCTTIVRSTDIIALGGAQGAGFASASSGVGVSEFAIFFNYLIIILLLLGSIQVASGVSQKAGNFAGKWAKMSMGAGGAVAFAGTAYATRRGGRAVGRRVAESEALNRLAGRRVNTGFATLDKVLNKTKDASIRGTQIAGGKMANASFDARRGVAGEFLTGQLKSATGIDVSGGKAPLVSTGKLRTTSEQSAYNAEKDKTRIENAKTEAAALSGTIEQKEAYIKSRLGGKSKADKDLVLASTVAAGAVMDKFKEEEAKGVIDRAKGLHPNSIKDQEDEIMRNLSANLQQDTAVQKLISDNRAANMKNVSAQAAAMFPSDMESQERYMRNKFAGVEFNQPTFAGLDAFGRATYMMTPTDAFKTPEMVAVMKNMKESELKAIQERADALHKSDPVAKEQYLRDQLGTKSVTRKVLSGYDQNGNPIYQNAAERRFVYDTSDLKKTRDEIRQKRTEVDTEQKISDIREMRQNRQLIPAQHQANGDAFLRQETGQSIQQTSANKIHEAFQPAELVNHAEFIKKDQLLALGKNEDFDLTSLRDIRNTLVTRNANNQWEPQPQALANQNANWLADYMNKNADSRWNTAA